MLSLKRVRQSAVFMLLMMLLELCSGVCTVSRAAGFNEQKFGAAATLLYDLNVVKTAYDGTVPIDRQMTRIDFVKLFVNFFDGTVENGHQEIFKDVENDGEEAGIIEKAISRGLINGDKNGYFYPQQIITYYDAAVICANALQYHFVKDFVSYYDGYVQLAEKLEIDDGVVNKNENFCVSDAYLMVYNTLCANVIEMTGLTNSSAKYAESENTLLSLCKDIYKAEAIVSGTHITKLTGESNLAENDIELEYSDGSTEVFEGRPEFAENLGYNVTAFLKIDDSHKNQIVSMFKREKGYTETYIDGEYVIQYKSKTRKLMFDKVVSKSNVKVSTSHKSVTIPVDCNVIYNGQYAADCDKVYEIINTAAEGKGNLNIDNITLLEYSGKNSVSVMFVNAYENVVTDYVTSDGKVADYYGETVIDTKKDDAWISIRDNLGEDVEVKNIKRFDVLSVKKGMASKAYIDITVVSNSVSGSLDKISAGDDENTITLDGQIYYAANKSNRKTMIDALSVKKEYTLLLDIKGRVAGCILNTETNQRIGYVLSAKYNDEEEQIYLKIFSPDDSNAGGSVRKYNCTEKLKINGIRIDADTYDCPSLAYNLIRYTVNEDGNIHKIETASETLGTDTLAYFTGKKSSRENTYANKLVYKGTARMFTNNSGGAIGFDENTIFLQVPVNQNVQEQDIACKRIGPSSFTNDLSYNVEGYVYDKNNIFCDVILYYYDGEAGKLVPQDYERNLFVVDKVYTTVNDDNETVTAIRGMCKGMESVVYSKESKFMRYESAEKKLVSVDIHKGDLLQIARDCNGYALAVKRVYDRNNDTYQDITENKNLNEVNYVIIGKPFYVQQPFIRIMEKSDESHMTASDAAKYTSLFPIPPSARVYIYDMIEGKLSLGTNMDIVGYMNGAAAPNRIVARTSYATSAELVIYKQ